MTLAGLRLSIRPPAWLVRAAIALLALALTVGAEWGPQAPGTVFADEWLRDRMVRLQVSDLPEPRILVVDVDEASLSELGPWPWPHTRIAELVENLLSTYAARGVALDIVLPKPDPGNDGDTRLALLARHGPLVLAQALDYAAERPEVLRSGELGGATGAVLTRGAPVATGYIANHAALARNAAHVGNIGFIPDPDGALRRVPLMSSYGASQYPALQLALVGCCSPGPRLDPPPPLLRVAYRRDWSAYTVVSASEILRQSLEPAAYRDRLVIVGSSSLTLGDRVTTPLAESRPGLAVQAAVLSTLLDTQAGLAPAPWPGRLLACGFALCAVLLANFALPRLSAAAGVGMLALLVALWLGLAYVISAHDAQLATTGPLASVLFLLAVAVPYQWQLSQGRSRHLLDTLRQYVAPEVVEQLLQSEEADPLAPRQLDVTTLIADLEGYTSHVEAMPVREAAELTRAFLDCLTGPVIEQHGTLDKYTGDGLVAFWGAPLPIAQHADLALDAALAIVERVAQLSRARVADGKAPLRVRIGIESGVAMAGDFGTSFRSIYTAVGDSVNTASRLEQAARDFPQCIIVGAGTVERAQRHRFLVLGQRLLRGKEKPSTLFAIDTRIDAPLPDAPARATLETPA